MSPRHGLPDLAVILKGRPHGMDDEDDGEEHDPEQAKLDAAEALIEAVHAKDAHGVVEATEALHDLCASDGGEEEEPEET
jgi:hypothetical protein